MYSSNDPKNDALKFLDKKFQGVPGGGLANGGLNRSPTGGNFFIKMADTVPLDVLGGQTPLRLWRSAQVFTALLATPRRGEVKRCPARPTSGLGWRAQGFASGIFIQKLNNVKVDISSALL